MSEHGSVELVVKAGIATIEFHHPKSNSLPASLLREIAARITECGGNEEVRVVVLRSRGDRAFCAGASFGELQAWRDEAGGKQFFMGFALLISAMKSCPKFIIARVQGKAIGGGVGLAAAADYALAHASASIKLSELALGLGPFVIGPAVTRKLGTAAFSILSIDNQWRDARWAMARGLYADLFETHRELDEAVENLARQMTRTNPEAMAALKTVFWEGTEHWDALLAERAVYSGRLALSEHTAAAIAAFGKE